MSKVIGFNNAMFWTDDTGILYCEFSNNDTSIKLEQKNVDQYINAIKTLCEGKPMPFLIDLKDISSTFSISAAKLVTNNPELVKLRISESYLVNTLGMKLWLTCYKRLYGRITPFATFNDINSAKEYCLEAKNNFYKSA